MGFVIAGAHAMGETSHDAALLVGMPLVYVLSMVPLTLGGHGLREGLYVGILGALGVASDVALGLAGIWLLACFGFSVIGAFVSVFAPVKRAEGAGASPA
jgi:hypothetical protein